MAGTTHASRPASNLITKCLFPHPSAGAYSALPIKREWNVLPCTVPLFFLSSATSASRPTSNLITKCLFPYPSASAYTALTTKKRMGRTTMYSPALFFLSSPPYASRPITKFLITICSKSCPNHRKAPWTYCLCTVPGAFLWLEQPLFPGLPQIYKERI